MADRRLTGAAPWLRVLVVYALARVATTLLIALSSALAPAEGRHGQDPSMLDYIAGWDAAWYREIALNGYPSELPVDASGNVQQNAWAFMPIYPWLARGISLVWPGAGPVPATSGRWRTRGPSQRRSSRSSRGSSRAGACMCSSSARSMRSAHCGARPSSRRGPSPCCSRSATPRRSSSRSQCGPLWRCRARRGGGSTRRASCSRSFAPASSPCRSRSRCTASGAF